MIQTVEKDGSDMVQPSHIDLETGDGAPQELVFAAPWEAKAFAMVVALHKAGAFSWSEWTQTLGRQIRQDTEQGNCDSYYEQWLKALETLLAEKSMADGEVIDEYQHAWEHATRRTPHGQPIELMPSDFHH